MWTVSIITSKVKGRTIVLLYSLVVESWMLSSFLVFFAGLRAAATATSACVPMVSDGTHS